MHVPYDLISLSFLSPLSPSLFLLFLPFLLLLSDAIFFSLVSFSPSLLSFFFLSSLLLLFLLYLSSYLLSLLLPSFSPLSFFLSLSFYSFLLSFFLSGPLLEKLKEQIELCRSFANNKDESYAHITEEERDVLRNEGTKQYSTYLYKCPTLSSFSPHLPGRHLLIFSFIFYSNFSLFIVWKTESWANEQSSLQNKMDKSANPVLTVAIITKIRNDLFKISRYVYVRNKSEGKELCSFKI